MFVCLGACHIWLHKCTHICMCILSGLEVQSIKFVFGGLQLTVYLFVLTVLWTRTHESPIWGLNFMVNPLQMSTVNWFVIGIGPV